MASKYSKIKRTIDHFKSFLKYNHFNFNDYYKSICFNSGYRSEARADDLINFLIAIQGNLYDVGGLSQLFDDENPVSDKEILNRLHLFKKHLNQYQELFNDLSSNNKSFDFVAGICYEVWNKTLDALKLALELAEEDSKLISDDNLLDKIEFNAYDINLNESYAELLRSLKSNTYDRLGISQEEYLSRIKSGVESYSKYHKLGSLDSVPPIIIRYPAYNYHAHLAFQVMTFDINKIHALLDFQHENYFGLDDFTKIAEHGVYDWIKHNSPFDNSTRLRTIMDWVGKRKGFLHKNNKVAIKIGNEILDKFKKANRGVGEIIMSRVIFLMPRNLNPIEKKHFDKIVNGLIADGFIDYSNQEPNFIRLGERGFRRIYEEQEEELPFQDIEGNDILPIVVILTAIKEEYAAVRAHLIEHDDYKKDSVVYEQGIFLHNGKRIAKVYIKECRPKNSTAAQETQRALTNFRPDCILFVGIAGSRKPHDFKLGDVIFAEKIHHYEGGKSELDGFKPRPDDVTPTFALQEIAIIERHKDDWKTLIKSKLDFEVSADLGVIASGDKVVEHFDSETGKLISAYYGDSACVEMEGYGFLKAITNQGKEFAVTFGGVVRGVSDILEQELNVSSVNSSADRRPNNAKKIASETAAAFAFWLIFKAYK